MERTVVLLASLNGVLLLDTVARVDPELFDGRRLARTLVEDLLRGWGADGRSLAAAVGRVEAMAADGPLATRPDAGGEGAGGPDPDPGGAEASGATTSPAEPGSTAGEAP
jgi:hypothetical protein